MTTAHRPTWAPARGGTGKVDGLASMTQQTSSRDLNSHTKLKYRQIGQDAAEELTDIDFKAQLDRRELEAKTKRDRDSGKDAAEVLEHMDKRPRLTLPSDLDLDADDSEEDDDDDLEDDDDDDDDDDEDDTAALLAELEKLKKERAEEQAEKNAAKAGEEERIRAEAVMQGNPLLRQDDAGDFSVKRRWDDDVIFKNCARQEEPSKKDRTFINDTLRSEFHRKFMTKYIV